MSKRDEIVDIAMSQVGYEETPVNITKYGEWFGMQDEWCDIFVCWCANQVGISEDIIPKLACCDDTGEWFDSRGRYRNSKSWGGDYYPTKGDLILFDWDRSGDSDHIGIVGSVDDNTVYTIEGNKDNKVKYCAYDLDDRHIRAFCVPDYPESKRNNDIKQFINKDSATPVFSDTYLDHQIGFLNPNEKCECYEIFENRAVVFFKVDGTDKYKVGYTSYIEGVK